MGHRELSITVAGIVAGVILGAGAGAVVTSAPLSASLTDQVIGFFAVPKNIDAARARNIKADVQPVETSNAPTVKDTSSTESSSSEASTLPANACDVARDVLKQMAAALESTLPRNIRNVEAWAKLTNAQVKIDMQYCPPVDEATTESASSSSEAAFDNHCDTRFKPNTVRYSQCKIHEQQKMAYPAR